MARQDQPDNPMTDEKRWAIARTLLNIRRSIREARAIIAIEELLKDRSGKNSTPGHQQNKTTQPKASV